MSSRFFFLTASLASPSRRWRRVASLASLTMIATQNMTHFNWNSFHLIFILSDVFAASLLALLTDHFRDRWMTGSFCFAQIFFPSFDLHADQPTNDESRKILATSQSTTDVFSSSWYIELKSLKKRTYSLFSFSFFTHYVGGTCSLSNQINEFLFD